MNPNSRSQLFRQLARQLHEGCQRRGLPLPGGAAEHILADHITALAAWLRVTDRHAMQTYLTDEAIDQLVDKCLQAKAERDLEVDLASPLLLPIPHTARIIAALGMAITAATTSADHSTATTAIREAADTLTNIALALSRAGDTGHALIAPATAVAARAELTRFADHLADATWTIPDVAAHDDAADETSDPPVQTNAVNASATPSCTTSATCNDPTRVRDPHTPRTAVWHREPPHRRLR